MSLIDLKNYLQTRQWVMLSDIVNHFDTTPETARTLLGHWQKKGKVLRLQAGGCGKGCAGCSRQGEEAFCWREQAEARVGMPLPMPSRARRSD